MSEQNGHVEIEVGEKKTRLKRALRRMDLLPMRSILGEIVQNDEAYRLLLDKWEKTVKQEDAEEDDRIKAMNAVADLKRGYRERSLPLFNSLYGEFEKLADGGTPLGDYEMEEFSELAAKYIGEHCQTKEQEKNSSDGSASS